MVLFDSRVAGVIKVDELGTKKVTELQWMEDRRGLRERPPGL
jgi:hypothetical protein